MKLTLVQKLILSNVLAILIGATGSLLASYGHWILTSDKSITMGSIITFIVFIVLGGASIALLLNETNEERIFKKHLSQLEASMDAQTADTNLMAQIATQMAAALQNGETEKFIEYEKIRDRWKNGN